MPGGRAGSLEARGGLGGGSWLWGAAQTSTGAGAGESVARSFVLLRKQTLPMSGSSSWGPSGMLIMPNNSSCLIKERKKKRKKFKGVV